MSIWVVSTSPLVFLGNLGRLVLLRHEGREVYIPHAVAEETAEKPDAVAQAVQVAMHYGCRCRRSHIKRRRALATLNGDPLRLRLVEQNLC
jgi:hypothetical protein